MDIENNDYRKILLCLIAIIAIVVLMFNTFFDAKYRTKVSGTDTVRIAKWKFDVDTSSNASELYVVSENDNGTNTYDITITNESEVSSSYALVLSNVPVGLQVKLDNGIYRSTNDGVITINNAGSFLVNGETSHTHTLTFKDLLSSSNQGDMEIHLDVVFEQID